MFFFAKFKIVLSYVAIALIIFLLSLVNFYQTEFHATFPTLPALTLPVVSFVVAVIITSYFWHRKEQDELIKYSFLTIATHKFRTPLTAIKWAAESLRKPVTNEEQKIIADQITQSNERLIQIVDILAGLAKMDDKSDYDLVAVSFREMVEQTIAKYGPRIKEKNITFSIDIGEHIPMITVDVKRIQFAIEMMFENAIKYTPPGGKIKATVIFKNDSIVLAVKDSGIGMTTLERARLFKKFFRSEAARQTDPEGMGLGMFIAQAVVRRHHGELWAESPGRGKGATFYMRLKIKS